MKTRTFLAVLAAGCFVTGTAMAQWAPSGMYPNAWGGGVPVGYFEQGGPAPQTLTPVPESPSTGPTEACPTGRLPVWQVWGEYLYLRPSDVDVPWAVAINGAIQQGDVPIQVGRIANADIDFDSGFRVGVGRVVDECSSAGVSYTFFESHSNDSLSTDAPLVLRSLVAHPGTLTAAADYLRGIASNDVDFQLIDADYRHIFRSNCYGSWNWLVGGRYAQLEQDFSSTFFNNGVENVLTDIRFYGGGIRLGLEGERHFQNCNLMVYGRSAASFVAGDFRARYFQGQSFTSVEVDTNWRGSRVVPILDLELGSGWVSDNGCVMFTVGYMVSAWFNAVDADTFIRGVQSNNFSDMDDTVVFDGLVGRAEIRF
ncbi:Major outer membrane protein [Thermogutta terrifontis]|jgi:hypothetical protein|uniref:Major outer membrane protein n=1 Tax=Thermogutta terrifontis TaxID=1331910 RepID=A0A286RBW6_9BACT|nr:Lpg1974 family pore-forming outer membrane protein [Thermogutta terrifontis]ASV73461.1 Major outer membrane protein [Thermogutta terrifontis]